MSGRIRVNIIGAAATVFDRKSCEADARPGMRLRDLLAGLSDSAGPDYKEKVYDRDTGKINEYLAVFINAREARSLQGPDTILKDGDVVTIMPPMAGG
ncbi:MAG: ThiS family protein [Methanocella sp. PtaU1.Bin125]|nr:MAG: ThiS family protein [Methanocella sp. PtaU1.Bin125]